MYEVNLENLRAGIRFWTEVKTRWPNDFHNQLYMQLWEIRAEGLTNEWWNEIVDILWSWVAIRPKTKSFIFERGKEQLSQLQSEYSSIINRHPGIVTIETVEWKTVEKLFLITKNIKGVASPVFASKLSHFILPGVFPIIDQEVLGGSSDYREYWGFCKALWQLAKDQDELIVELKKHIAPPIALDYPWITKVVELSLIGIRNPITLLQGSNLTNS